MIVEHEVIEQIQDEAMGRPLSWVCDLIRQMDDDNDPFLVLEQMWHAGYIEFVDELGRVLPKWRSAALLRNDASGPLAGVVATDGGLLWVHGKVPGH